MVTYIVNNKAGLLSNERTVLELFSQRIEQALNDKYKPKLRFKIAVGFFFFEGFVKLYPYFKKLYENGNLEEIKIIMGPQTTLDTKIMLEQLKEDAVHLNNEVYEFVHKLYSEGIIDFRIYTERQFHPKIYIFGRDGYIDEVWAGSANLTSSGIEKNIELLVPTGATAEERELFSSFFDELWTRSSDKISDLKIIEVLKEAAEEELIYVDSKDFIIHMIKLLNKDYLLKNLTDEVSYLADFQNINYYQIFDKFEKYGGTILANSVGLGKTDISCAVIKNFINKNQKVLLIIPPAIEYHWKNTLKKVGVDPNQVTILSMGLLQSQNFNCNNYTNYDLIVVDEAHHYRRVNPKPNRRKNLEEIIKLNSDNKCKILLITATPISTSILDILNLVSLLENRKFYKEIFESEGLSRIISNQKSIWKKIEENADQNYYIENIKETIKNIEDINFKLVCKISWYDAFKYFKDDIIKISGKDKFEDPAVFPVRYKYRKKIKQKIFDKVVPFLEKLNFEYAKMWNKEYKEDANLLFWYKWRLYKRLESSLFAFKSSLEYLREKNKEAKELVNKNVLNFKSKYFNEEDMNNMIVCFENLNVESKKKVLKNIEEDIIQIEKMLDEIENIGQLEKVDKKLQELYNIVKEKKDTSIIFTESADSAEYIYNFLVNKGISKIGLITGRSFQINNEYKKSKDYSLEEYDFEDEMSTITDKKELIEKLFQNGEINIIVATDIIGEGTNFPRTNIIINFDLPYNPVKLIQRAGRAIRLTNPKKILIFNFQPDKEIDKEIELWKRLHTRIENIISIIGLDFLIWSVNTGKIDRIREKQSAIREKLIMEYKNRLATAKPTDLENRLNITLSEEDKVLIEFINKFKITESDLELHKYNFSKPLYTVLQSQNEDYGLIYRFNEHYYTKDLKSGSATVFQKLTKQEINEIKNRLNEIILKRREESVNLSENYSKEDKLLYEKLKELTKENFDFSHISVLSDREKRKIRETITKVENLMSFEREEYINELKNLVLSSNKIFKEDSNKGSQLVGVIKYVKV